MYIVAVCGPQGAPLDEFVEGFVSIVSERISKENTIEVLAENNDDLDSLAAKIKESSANIIFVKGHLLYTNKELSSLFTVKLYLETDMDLCLANLFRGIPKSQELLQNLKMCASSYEVIKAKNTKSVDSKMYADVVIPAQTQEFSTQYQLLLAPLLSPTASECLASKRPFFLKSGARPDAAASNAESVLTL